MSLTPQWAIERIEYAKNNNLSVLELGWTEQDVKSARRLHRKTVSGMTPRFKKELPRNKLSEVPVSVLELPNLTHLTLSNNNLNELPEWFIQLSNLKFLDLSGNSLCTLPETFPRLTNIAHLILSDNKLCTLPDDFHNL